MLAIQKRRIFKSTESLKAPRKQNWSSVAFNPSLLALMPNTLNLNVHKFQIYAFKITGFLNCSPGAAVKNYNNNWLPTALFVCLQCVCVCVCVCVFTTVCVLGWVKAWAQILSMGYLTWLHVSCHEYIMPKDTHGAKFFSPIKWLSRMPRPLIK